MSGLDVMISNDYRIVAEDGAAEDLAERNIEDDEEYERVAELFTERLEEYFDIIDEFDEDDGCDCDECNHHHLS